MARITRAQRIYAEQEQEALEFFEQALSSLPDPRRLQGKRYALRTVIVTALMAMVCGADDAQAMEIWSKAHENWLSGFLETPHGTPSQDVYLAVFGALQPDAFGTVFRHWTNLLMFRLEVKNGSQRHIAIDGKTSRRSHDKANEQPAIHTVSAWLSDEGLVLGQVKTAKKSNEIKAIPELLKLLDIRGSTITIDAAGCQTKIASSIVEADAHYLLAVKDNQPKLKHDIETAFKYADEHGSNYPELPPISIEKSTEVGKEHGRLETRTIEMSRDISWLTVLDKWPEVSYFARVTRERTILSSGKKSKETSYYIGSDPEVVAHKVANFIRRHWSIETGLHWVLDMAFAEDQARHRAKNVAQNMTILRHFALNLIKQDKTRKVGVANSRKRAGWDNGYLLKLITAG